MIGKYKIAALCISQIHDSTTHDIISELNEELTRIGYRLFVYHTCSDLYWSTPGETGEASVFGLIDMRLTDVLIIADDIIKNKTVINRLIDAARDFDTPVITIGGCYPNIVSIDLDYEGGFEEIVRHVVEFHGIRDLHFIAGFKGNSFSDARIGIFEKVLAENGIPFEKASMLSYGDFWSVPASDAVTALIEQNRLPRAIVCANDSMALAVCATLINKGFRVPEDIIVTGFDGIPDIEFSSPKITSSQRSFKGIAHRIAELLEQGDEALQNGERHLVKPFALISESCGCKPHIHVNAAKHLSDLNGRFNRYKEEERTLNEIAAGILSAKDLPSAANELRSTIIFDMLCILRKEVIDDTVDPLNADDLGRADTLCVFYDSNAEQPFTPYDFPAKEIIPRLESTVDNPYPLIFTALHFIDVPLGYVVFTYSNYDLNNYEKIPQVMNALNNSIGGYRNMRYQQYMTKQVEKLSLYDQLTEMFTRNGCLTAYDSMIHTLRRQGRPITVIMADLDGLKPINDNYGHNEGDFAIRTVAAVLRETVPENAVCIRMGGDELVAFFPSTQPLEAIREDFGARLSDANRVSGKPYTVASSIGIIRTENGDIPSFEELVRAADEEMYKDKIKKKNRRS